MLRHSILLVVVIILAGCATTQSGQPVSRTEVVTYGAGFPSPTVKGEVADFQWRAIRFRMPIDSQGESNWDMDLLLAHRVLGLMIAEYRDQLPLWRFHRRAADDAAQHQFSFIFYSDTATAKSMFASLDGEPLLEKARTAGLLIKVIKQVKVSGNATLIDATSDQHWHPALQKQWPSFIMGVSATWLGLIEELVPEPESEHETLEAVLSRYHQANEEIGTIWKDQGQHAFFHHISAIFGYQPLVIKNYMQF